jgi:toxin secretion/phage lysis holin
MTSLTREHRMVSHWNLPAAVKWVGAIILAQWLQVPHVVRVLMAVMFLDYVTGITAAFKIHKFDRDTAFWGLVQKLLVLILIAAAQLVEDTSGISVHALQWVSFAFIVNEFVSICDNCARVGVRVPEKVLLYLKSIQKLRSAAPARSSAGKGEDI